MIYSAVVRVLQNIQNLVISRCFAEDSKEMAINVWRVFPIKIQFISRFSNSILFLFSIGIRFSTSTFLWIAGSAILILPQTQNIAAEKYPYSRICQPELCVCKGPGKRRHIVADTLLPMMFLGLRKLGNILLRTQNVSEQNQKHFLYSGHKICVRNKCYARGQTGKHLCRQQCVRYNVSSFARALTQLTDN